ncbi:MAG: DUF899 family protein [Aliidongia sp.]
MSTKAEILIPADQLARDSSIRVPNESVEYRAARQALLAQEFELRRQIERVAAMRRALPPGGPVTGDYRFETEDGPSDSQACSAISRRWWSTTTCLVPRGSGHAPCARTCSTPGTATPTTSLRGYRWWSWRARRWSGSRR